MKRRLLATFMFAFALVLPGLGQDQRAVPAPALSAELPYTEVLDPPMPIRERMPLAFSTEMALENVLMLGIEAGVSYDDNALLTSSNHLNDVSYIALPSIAVVKSQPRLRWSFAYSPALTVNQHLSERNVFAHGLSFTADYRLTPHVGVRLREGFRKTNDVFSTLFQGPLTPGSAPGQTPNSSVVTPIAELTSNTSAVDLTYQFGANSVVGASGSYYFANYGREPTSTATLVDSNSVGADGFYAHRFANRHWAGLMYSFQRLQFQPGSRTNVQRTPLFYAISLSSHGMLSLWAGPEYSITPHAVPATVAGASTSRSRLGVGAGGDLTWEGNRTSFRLGYLQQTTDGGGLAEAVVLQEFLGEVRYRLRPRWVVTASLTRSKDRPLYATGFLPYETWIGGAGFEYLLTDRWMARLGYSREYRDVTTQPPVSAASRNRVLFSLSYSFLHPLGR